MAMMIPVAIGMAMAAAGGAMQAKARKNAQNAETQSVMGEQGRQRDFETEARAGREVAVGEAQGKFGETLAEASPAARAVAMTDATGKREAAYNAAMPAFDPNRDMLSGQAGAPSLVRSLIEAKLGSAIAANRAEAGKRAALNAYGDVNQGVGFQLARGAENQQTIASNARAREGMIKNFMEGSQSVLPLEQQAAQRKASSPMGDTLSTLGTALAGSGMKVTPGDVGSAFSTATTGMSGNNPGLSAVSGQPIGPWSISGPNFTAQNLWNRAGSYFRGTPTAAYGS